MFGLLLGSPFAICRPDGMVSPANAANGFPSPIYVGVTAGFTIFPLAALVELVVINIWNRIIMTGLWSPYGGFGVDRCRLPYCRQIWWLWAGI